MIWHKRRGVSDQNHYLKVFNNSEKTLRRGGRKANMIAFGTYCKI